MNSKLKELGWKEISSAPDKTYLLLLIEEMGEFDGTMRYCEIGKMEFGHWRDRLSYYIEDSYTKVIAWRELPEY